MKIGELAKRAGVSPSKIRFLETRGVLCSERLANGYRDYSEEDVSSLQIILQAQSVGFTLEEIERTVRSQQLSCADMLDRLKEKLGELDRHIAQSTTMRDRLAQMIGLLTQRHAENGHLADDVRVHGPLDLPCEPASGRPEQRQDRDQQRRQHAV